MLKIHINVRIFTDFNIYNHIKFKVLKEVNLNSIRLCRDLRIFMDICEPIRNIFRVTLSMLPIVRK